MPISDEDIKESVDEGFAVVLAEMAKWHAEQEALRKHIANLDRKLDELLEWMADSLE